MKRLFAFSTALFIFTVLTALTALTALATLTACSTTSNNPAAASSPDTALPRNTDAALPGNTDAAAPAQDSFDTSRDISVVSREDGSGTRGAFIELFGVEVKDENGFKSDMTTEEAVIADKTAVMMQNIASDPYAIGYISLGSLNDTVKALQIDGVDATMENIKSGDYTIQRPFNIATKGEATGLAGDFIRFILSNEGQAVVAGKCIPLDDAPAYSGDQPAGQITIGGSTSVTPVMMDLKEAYEKINPNATIIIDETDSSSGMSDTINGTCEIGMASRALKDSERAQLTEILIAVDGIAVIVHNENPLTTLTKEQVAAIYTGSITKWNALP